MLSDAARCLAMTVRTIQYEGVPCGLMMLGRKKHISKPFFVEIPKFERHEA
jgi:hypothetical protein